MTSQATPLDTRPLAGALGAEVFGLDLAQPLSDAQFKQVEQALHDHLVLFFRDQQLTPEQHKAFSLRFGQLLEVPFVRALAGHPEILPVTKGKSEKTKRNFGGLWHSDMSYSEAPPLGSALYARVIPPYGGDTLWTNMYAAFDGLSDKLKEVLISLRAIHSPVRSYGAGGAVVNNGDPAHKMDVRTDERANAEVSHPVVRVHPGTGRKALYVNRTYTVRFDGMTEEESAPLLNYLFEESVRPEYTVRLRWQAGTLALWDNRCTQHLAMNDYNNFDRELHRTTISGTVPVAATA